LAAPADVNVPYGYYYAGPPPKPSPLPDQPREYHEFYRAPAFRAWKPWVAIVAAAVGAFVIMLLLSISAVSLGLIDVSAFLAGREVDGFALFAVNNVSLALCIPVIIGVHVLIFRQRPGWLFSITGAFRWKLFGKFLLLVLPFELAALGYDIWRGALEGLSWRPDGLLVIAVILLTTPFQAAAEEIAVRGLLLRCVGSMFKWRLPGLIVGGLISAIVFMLLHGAGDLWLNIFYFIFAAVAVVLVWRTGGLEAAIAMHIVHNLLSELFLPWMDMTGIFDREAGVGSAEVLVYVVLNLVTAALIVWQAKRWKLPVARVVTQTDR
jgi:membrane protease YdiL (CAAX protease family)